MSEQPPCVKPYILKFNTYINISFSLFISSTDVWAFFTCKPLFWALGDLHWTKHPISVMKIYVSVSLVHGSQLLTTINWCQLQIGTWQEHCQWLQQGRLPSVSAEIEPCAAAAVALQYPPEGVQGGVRHSVELGGTGLQIVGNFHYQVLWSQSFHVLISRKALSLHDDMRSSWLAENLL